MATIKQIDDRTVHQIQSGQVIVDLCSVVKELVENSIDAGATIIDVRFKNQGLDLIEVQDNGSGISPANYPTVALKHHTSKLSTYSDISTLETFGFRGEALASLCALSTFTISTCLAESVPRGSKLTFEPSGQLKDTSVVASQRGTTVSVERLFHNLPVRRRELERNIKREWHKVIALLNQYACIQTNLKFSVSQQPTKGKRIVLFSTKGNPTTRENIINIFGAKTMSSLVALDLRLEMQPSSGGPSTQLLSKHDTKGHEVCIVGHISRPVGGEGRQTPDRQMFFVNGRPCGLPQFAKTFNEVYRSYNSSQSPFIFADIKLDTHLYDVNVSPDKRSILLHDQHRLLDTLRTSLTELFDTHDYTVPLSRPVPGHSSTQKPSPSLDTPSTRKSTRTSNAVAESAVSLEASNSDSEHGEDLAEAHPILKEPLPRIMNSRALREHGPNQHLISQWLRREPSGDRTPLKRAPSMESDEEASSAAHISRDEESGEEGSPSMKAISLGQGTASEPSSPKLSDAEVARQGSEQLQRPSASQHSGVESTQRPIPAIQPTQSSQGRINTSLVSHRPSRQPRADITTITIGDHAADNFRSPLKQNRDPDDAQTPSFGNHLSRLFAAREDSADAISEQEDEVVETDNSSISSQRGPKVGNAVELIGAEASQADEPPGQHNDSRHSSSDGEDEKASVVQPQDNPGEEHAAEPRIQAFQGGTRRKEATFQYLQRLQIDERVLQTQMQVWSKITVAQTATNRALKEVEDIDANDAEARLALIISRSDFVRMRVAGQFNLGFIIAIRPAASVEGTHKDDGSAHDELLIIDQHASDEKYNFERLQNTMVLQSQRLVHPMRLQLTALEEEIVMQNMAAIEANGFKVEVDMSGDWPVGSRAQLTSLPLSRETTFDLSDFEELVALLGESESESTHIPRPSRVRKMFAMRACRSSIMIGKPLSTTQMYTLVRHMGEMDKPWNCPHGRPTMRHLCQLQAWDDKGWKGDIKTGTHNPWASFAEDG